MRKIIYLTNPDKLFIVIKHTFEDIECKNYILLKSEKSEIILLFDQANVADKNIKDLISSFFNGIDIESVRYVHHTNKGKEVQDHLREDHKFGGYNTFEGVHIPGNPLYKQLNLLVNNNDLILTDEIFETIWNNSGFDIDEKIILNKKLGFLHKLLGGTIDENLKTQFENEGYEIDYKEDDPINSIIQIRDNLLDKHN